MQRKRSASLISLRALVTLVAMGVVAVFIYGASQSAPSAHAAWSTCQIGAQAKEFGQVRGKDGKTHQVTLRSLTDGTNPMAWTYSAQINARTGVGTGGYNEASWRDAPVANLPKIQGVLMAGVPQVSAADLGAKAGIPGLTEDQAALATQAAIWHFSDNFELDMTNPTGGANLDTPVGVAYQWLISSVVEQSEPAEFLSLPTHGAGIEGDRVGPITFSTKDSSAMSLVVTPAQTMMYANGETVDLKAVQSGRPMYLKASTKSGDAVLSASTASGFALSPGRLFVSNGNQAQIVARAQTKFKQVSVTVSWQLAQQPSGHGGAPTTDSAGQGHGVLPGSGNATKPGHGHQGNRPSETAGGQTVGTPSSQGGHGVLPTDTHSSTSFPGSEAPETRTAEPTGAASSTAAGGEATDSGNGTSSPSSSSTSTAHSPTSPAHESTSQGAVAGGGTPSRSGAVQHPAGQGQDGPTAPATNPPGDQSPAPSITASVQSRPVPPPPMAQTGANMIGGVMTALAFLVAGGLFLTARKRTQIDLR